MALAVAVVVAGVHCVVRIDDYAWMLDLKVYQAGADILLGQGSLYAGPLTEGELMFQYPPFGAVVFIPFTLAGATAVGVVWNVVGLLALQWVLLHCLDRVGVRGTRASVWAGLLAAGSLVLEPVEATLLLGQVNLAVMAVAFWEVTRRPGARWNGVALGVMTGIKLVPAVFVVYLLLTRRTRAAGVATAVFAATVGVGFLVRPDDSWTYWTSLTGAPKAERPEQVYTSSLWSVMVRAFHGTDGLLLPWLVVAVVAGVAGMAIAVRLGRSGPPGGHRDLLGLVCVALVECLVLPVSWNHYWVWVLPLAVLLLPHARASWAAAAGLALVVAAFALRVFEWGIDPGGGLAFSPTQVLQTSVYPVVTVAVLVALAVIAGRPPPTPPRPGPPGRTASTADSPPGP
ncbi:glycosyltransferase 87 family protein [Actinokineospora sp. UTMC 2448]|uniref:glycosyltransferase 87 family protein n=1 Tax=Actinokineospora sp. UTMC 2448 TaxID=2268449 RepID=UPI002164CD04|nr:glycosyltransferase 87 family protein [Actinokineospora sp. UTMC 2448]UVS80422.1 alpha-(1-2)-phosphatidylinositol pentamannoside mannosyltransferase [Actinokineospora sp. UTMC 2448]